MSGGGAKTGAKIKQASLHGQEEWPFMAEKREKQCTLCAEGSHGGPTVTRVKAELSDDDKRVPPKQRAENSVEALCDHAETWIVTHGDIRC